MPRKIRQNSPKAQQHFYGQTLNMTPDPNQSEKIENQNQTHNTKKESEGRNTKR